MPAWLLIANEHAGGATDDTIQAVTETLRKAGTVEVVVTEKIAELDAALARGADRGIVVAGGDGTIHHVVQRLHDAGRLRDQPIGVLPMGTGNDLAHGLGFPREPVEAACRLVEASPRLLDLLLADDGTVVVNAVHVGLGAAVVHRAAPLKRRLGRLAFPLGAAIAAAREDGWSLQVTVDGRDLVPPTERVLVGAAANLPTIGGGTPLCPDARPDDGNLDVVVALDRGRPARLALGAALRHGTHVDRDDVVSARGAAVRIRGEPVGHNADGELSDDVADRTYRVVPFAWHALA